MISLTINIVNTGTRNNEIPTVHKDTCIAAAAMQNVTIVQGVDGFYHCANGSGDVNCSTSNGVTTISTTCKYLSPLSILFT